MRKEKSWSQNLYEVIYSDLRTNEYAWLEMDVHVVHRDILDAAKETLRNKNSGFNGWTDLGRGHRFYMIKWNPELREQLPPL